MVRECRPPARASEVLVGAPLDNGNVDARKRQLDRQHQPCRTPAGDDHRVLSHSHTPLVTPISAGSGLGRRFLRHDQGLAASSPVRLILRMERGRSLLSLDRLLWTDNHGTPLAVSLTGGNRNDVTQLIHMRDKVPPVRGRVGRSRRRPDCLYADRGDDHDKNQRLIRAKGVKHRIGRRGVEHGSGLGKHRYVVERTIALLHWCRRLRIRWEIRDDIHEAFLSLAAALICRRRLTH